MGYICSIFVVVVLLLFAVEASADSLAVVYSLDVDAFECLEDFGALERSILFIVGDNAEGVRNVGCSGGITISSSENSTSPSRRQLLSEEEDADDSVLYALTSTHRLSWTVDYANSTCYDRGDAAIRSSLSDSGDTMDVFSRALFDQSRINVSVSSNVFVYEGLPYISTSPSSTQQRDQRSKQNSTKLCIRGDNIPTKAIYIGNRFTIDALVKASRRASAADGDYTIRTDSNRWFLNVTGDQTFGVAVASVRTDSIQSVEITSNELFSESNSDMFAPKSAIMLSIYVLGGLLVGGITIFIVVRKRLRKRQRLERMNFSKAITSKKGSLQLARDEIQLHQKAWNIALEEIEMEKQIAKGSYGAVWRGTLHGKFSVAVKILHQSDIDDAASDAEIAFLMKARHPRLVWFLGCGKTKDGGAFLVLEYMEGGSLDTLLWGNAAKSGAPSDGDNDHETVSADNARRQKQLPWSDRLRLLHDVAKGMQYLQENLECIHRDLKSPNILLTLDSNKIRRAKVADFGLSRILNRSETRAPMMLTPRNGSRGRKQSAFSLGRSIRTLRKSVFGRSDPDRRRISASSLSSDRGRKMSGNSDPHGRSDVSIEVDFSDSGHTPSLSKRSSTASNSTASSRRSIIMTTKVGTAQWLAPENCRACLEMKALATYSQAIDVYAFGVVMWEILTMRPPWDNECFSHHILQRVARGERPKVPSDQADSAPAQYVVWMRDCWSQNPDKRPSFSEVAKYLNVAAGTASVDIPADPAYDIDI